MCHGTLKPQGNGTLNPKPSRTCWTAGNVCDTHWPPTHARRHVPTSNACVEQGTDGRVSILLQYDVTATTAAYYVQLAATIRSIGFMTVAANPGDRMAAQVRVVLGFRAWRSRLHDRSCGPGQLRGCPVEGLGLGGLGFMTVAANPGDCMAAQLRVYGLGLGGVNLLLSARCTAEM